MRAAVLLLALGSSACTTIQPGHLGLYFDLRRGLQREVLLPGRHYTGVLGRIEEFDVTLATRSEEIRTKSAEGLALDVRTTVRFKPVINELYELLTEVGMNYYEEVIGPEYKSSAHVVFAKHSYQELQLKREQIEDEVEAMVRRRTAGKHVAVLSITFESIQYAPEIERARREEIAAKQEDIRQRTLQANEDRRRKAELQYHSEQARMRNELALAAKQNEVKLAKAQAELDKVREENEAHKKVVRARAEADATKLLASAAALKAKAHTPLSVMLAGYEALRALAGNNTHIMLGDWSKVPSFLFPGVPPFGRAK
jgi:regulator of protease activity HflC (stomatin/prohibitin superfamily)